MACHTEHHNLESLEQSLVRAVQCFSQEVAIAIDDWPRRLNASLILDPTVRFESNDLDQAGEVEREKKNTYDKCIPFLKEKFHETFGERVHRERPLVWVSRNYPKKNKELPRGTRCRH
ncbi:unnamed protein product [Nezara viridula]|uniref:Uncharacterized protein n=1 Tax=Nezara viridula TaxID=85310 RepID=A0A9P0E5J7_NEZVI|nr:unnamed protein product [Nezara viridula]